MYSLPIRHFKDPEKDEPAVCKLRIEPDDARGWKLVAAGDCTEELDLLSDLPTRRRQYLERRIELEP